MPSSNNVYRPKITFQKFVRGAAPGATVIPITGFPSTWDEFHANIPLYLAVVLTGLWNALRNWWKNQRNISNGHNS